MAEQVSPWRGRVLPMEDDDANKEGKGKTSKRDGNGN
jgi:hypothetical protein